MSDRRQIIATWAVPAAVALLGGLLVAWPGYRERHRIDDRLARLDAKVARLPERTDEVVRLAMEVETRRRRIGTELRTIPDEPGTADLVRTLSLPIDDVTVVDQTFATSPPTSAVVGEESSLRAMPIAVDMKATFDSVFALIRAAESMDRLVRVTSVRATTGPDAEELPSPLLTATVGLDAIYREPEWEP